MNHGFENPCSARRTQKNVHLTTHLSIGFTTPGLWLLNDVVFMSLFSPCLITFSCRFMSGISHPTAGTVVVSLKLRRDLAV
jgi:hypothetical protein